jgi:hypothetical protein
MKNAQNSTEWELWWEGVKIGNRSGNIYRHTSDRELWKWRGETIQGNTFSQAMIGLKKRYWSKQP